LQIGLKILASDRGKFSTLVVGITIAVFLMMQITAIFSSVIHRLASNIINISAPIWIMDSSVNIQENLIPLPKSSIDLMRSIQGVKYAVPLVMTNALIRLTTGEYKNVELIGIDDTSLLGRPKIRVGNLQSIYKNNAYIGIRNAEYTKDINLGIGARFFINGRMGFIASLAEKPVVGLWGRATLYTTYTRAASLLPERATPSYILIQPKTIDDIPFIKAQAKQLGFLALTQREFIQRNNHYYLFNTGFGTNLWIMEMICFVIGLSIAGQTFYMFILENISLFGALKAIGAKNKELILIIFFQSMIVGIIGYGLGVLLSSIFMVIAKLNLENYTALVTYQSLLISFCMVLIIIAFTSLLGIRKVTQIQPYDIFRG